MEEVHTLATWLSYREQPSPLELVAQQEALAAETDAVTDENVSETTGLVVWEHDEMSEERIRECRERLAKSTDAKKNVNAWWRQKYITTSRKAWNVFFKTHADRFFKERHWLENDFRVLLAARSTPLLMLDAGCGTGAAFLPLMERLPHLRVIGFDLSERAVELIRAHPQYASGRACAFAADAVTTTDWPAAARAALGAEPGAGAAVRAMFNQRPCPRVPHSGGGGPFDVVLLLYMLSALPPEHHQGVINAAAAALAPGGHLLLRDYGLYDEAQLRFSAESRISDSLFVRHDGTLSYFFSVPELQLLASRAGLVVQDCRYLYRKYGNRKMGLELRRVWVHAVLRKPAAPLFV